MKNITKNNVKARGLRKNVFLTDYLRANLEDLTSMKPQTRAKLFFDQRQKMKDAIEYLSFMLNHLPEKQLEQVFNKEIMRPFFQSLFKLKPDNRKRIVALWRIILMDVAHSTYVLGLVGRERWQLLSQQGQRQLQALFSTVMFES